MDEHEEGNHEDSTGHKRERESACVREPDGK